MPKKESLPVGVGRVPEWWMELTPHYVLDLEEDEQTRKMMEEQEALYYAQMAANDDGRLAREWKSNWGGRSNTGGAGADGASALFGGRNFQPGSPGWDPKEWGIEANDPDYMSYLKGAKLPQSYIDAMMEFAHHVGLQYDASSLNPTGAGYGSGGRPAFTPAWAKKKLRATGQGAAIRHGIYDDSPNKHRNNPKLRANAHLASSTPESDPQPPTSPKPEAAPTPAPAPVAASPPASPKPKWTPPKPTPPPAPAPAPVEYTYNPAPIRSNTPAPAPAPVDTSVDKPKYSFNDYYYNAGAPVSPVAPVKAAAPEQAPEQAPKPVPVPAPAPAPTPPAPAQPQEEEEEYEEVVEYVEEYEDGEEGEEYEEYVEEYVEEEEEPAAVAPQAANLNDLQALLAQKQAELAKLQGM